MGSPTLMPEGSRTRMRLPSGRFSLLGAAEREVEAGALAFLALGPDAAAVPPHDPVHGRQPDSAARELFDRVEPLERHEQLHRVIHVEAGAVVPDEVDLLTILLGHADLDLGVLDTGSELPAVAQQVVEQDDYQLPVRARADAGGHLDRDVAIGLLLRKFLQDRAGDVADVHAFSPHRAL